MKFWTTQGGWMAFSPSWLNTMAIWGNKDQRLHQSPSASCLQHREGLVIFLGTTTTTAPWPYDKELVHRMGGGDHMRGSSTKSKAALQRIPPRPSGTMSPSLRTPKEQFQGRVSGTVGRNTCELGSSCCGGWGGAEKPGTHWVCCTKLLRTLFTVIPRI